MDWELVKYISIPVVASLIGYGTNVLAIIMTFAPMEYFGWGEAFFRRWGFSLGWQGTVAKRIPRSLFGINPGREELPGQVVLAPL